MTGITGPMPGAHARNARFYDRFRRAQRYLDDHGMPMRDRRLRTVWSKSRVATAVGAVVLAAANGVFAAKAHGGGLIYLFLPVSLGISRRSSDSASGSSAQGPFQTLPDMVRRNPPSAHPAVIRA